jgi:hypothetical protein
LQHDISRPGRSKQLRAAWTPLRAAWTQLRAAWTQLRAAWTQLRAAGTQLRAAGTPVLCDPPGSVAPHSHPGRKAVPRLQQHQARRSRPMLQHSILCFVGADVLHLMN